MSSTFTKAPVSVVILTFNEESNIAACLESCRWCDDVHVLDSGSTDATRDIAQDWGAQVHEHPFANFGAQRNWAIDNIPTRYAWNFHLDADERFTPALVREMARTLGSDGENSAKAAYFVPSKLIFMGRWLRYSSGYPTYQVRLFHKERCRFVEFGHGQREQTEGEVGHLKEPYLHFNFSKGLADWIAKHNAYSSKEAAEGLKRAGESGGLRDLAGADGVERRRALKNIAYALPGRAWLRFVYSYLVRGGWRDGGPGFHYSLMISLYEYWIEMKMRELRRQKTDAAR